ncbi:hypothetical protein ACIBBB_35770 [Streptomyces sp. NPDC051217]|uniref:hypothetical protein n=1 Tax=Streptomyces sp. NPDC051217 TaxID=3365644 RepID=UPI0037ACDD11
MIQVTRLTRRFSWLDHDGPLPITEGTIIRLAVEHLLSGGVNKPLCLWWSRTGAIPAVDRRWQFFLRRFEPLKTRRHQPHPALPRRDNTLWRRHDQQVCTPRRRR